MSGSDFFHSPVYKNVMAKVYGFGAALVLAGALFKIQHYPGAGFMLLVGMGTEIVIFIFSAFEPPHEIPDWSLVFPELVGLDPKPNSRDHGSGGGGSDLQALISSGHLDEATVEKLGEGLKKLSNTANSLSNLSDASMATDAYLESMKSASDSIGNFSTIQNKLGQSAQSLGSSFENTAKVVSESGTKLANDLSVTGGGFVDTIKTSGEQLVNAYQSFGETMKLQLENVSVNGTKYTEGLALTNEKLSSINAAYELQLNSITQQVEASQQLSKSLGDISDQLNLSVNDTALYKQEVANLSKTLGELNTIYGNMLSAMSVGNK
ncbi:type IX secretion system motor protein PorL/GldL [Geofilum sp. OHC36d9]|uniref:type IX secretion system motor protein PorL/GldL n=1 Tax=Geofilum sp. OHC36d9 TaxID=3458413 RepID=UPI004034A8DD